MNPTDAVQKSIIVCDLCGWEKSVEWKTISEWHNKACPECGEGVIVNDEDLQVFQMAEALLNLQAAVYPDGIDGLEGGSTVRINTAGMRKD